MCKALVHNNSTLKYVTKLACQNPMSVSGRNWRDFINFAQDISMISMNVKQVYGEWYDTVVSDNDIVSVCILRKKMISVTSLIKTQIIDYEFYIINIKNITFSHSLPYFNHFS